MSTTNFVNNITPINADWLNDVNTKTYADSAATVGYTPAGTGAVATTVQTKLRESVSVKDFGAKGDGVTDDTAAIQAAFTAINSSVGGSVYFPAGTYLLSNKITISKKCKIIGDGSSDAYSPQTSGEYSNQGNIATSIIKFTSSTLDCFSIEAVGCSIRDLHFYNSSTAISGCGVAVGTASIPANGIFIENCSFFGFWVGIRITQAAGYSIAFNKFYQQIKYGISVESQNNGGDEGDCVISGNSIMSGLAASSPDAGINYTGGGGLKIIGNKISREPPTAGALSVAHKKGIWIQPIAGSVSGVFNIVGNSIEAILEDGILLDTQAASAGVSNIVITGNEFNMQASLTNYALRGVSGAGQLPSFIYFGENTVNGCYSMVKSELLSGIKIGPNVIQGSALTGPVIDIENGINIGYKLIDQHIDNRPANCVVLLDKTGTNYNSNTIRQGTDKKIVREMPALNLAPTAVNLFAVDIGSVGASACIVELNFSGFMSGVGAYAATVKRLFTGSGGTATISTIGTDYFSGTQLLTWGFTNSGGVVTISVTCILAVGLTTTFAGIGSGEIRMTIDGTVRKITIS